MRRIAFITPESFLDVDLPIVKELNKQMEFFWIVTFASSKRNDQHVYSPEQIKEYSRLNGISHLNVLCPYRVSDPRRIKTSLHIIKKIREFDPDVIYFNSFFDPYLAVFSRVFLGKKKSIIALHDIELHPGSDSFFHKLSHWIIMNSFSNYHVFSDSQLKQFKVINPYVRTFLIGLFLKDFGQLKEEKTEQEGGKINFLFFGTDYPYKGLDVFIKAVNLLSQSTNDFIITVAGKSEKFDRFKDLIVDKSIFDLHLGFIKSEDIPGLFNKADFIVLPYYQVTQCGPLMIAFNYNLPAIASDLPGFTENIIDRKTGFIFPKGDHYKLAEVLGNIVLKDRIGILKMKVNLSEYVKKNYDYIKKTEEYLDMFLAVSE